MATLGLYFTVSSCNQHSLLKAHLCSYPSLDLPMGLSSLVPMVISAPISLPVPVSLRLYNREHHKVGCPGWAGPQGEEVGAGRGRSTIAQVCDCWALTPSFAKLAGGWQGSRIQNNRKCGGETGWGREWRTGTPPG